MYRTVAVWLREEGPRERILLKKSKRKRRYGRRFWGPIKSWVNEYEFVESRVLQIAQYGIWRALGKGFSVSKSIEITEINFSFFRNERKYQGVRHHFLVLFQLDDPDQSLIDPDNYLLLNKRDLLRISTNQKKRSGIVMFPEELEILKKQIWAIQTILV